METRTPTSGTAGHGNQLPVSTMVRGFGMLIESARHQVAVAANVALTTVYWESVIASGPRSCGVCGQYGARIVTGVGRELRYGRGFREKDVRRVIQFAEVFSDRETAPRCGDSFDWNHLKNLLPANRPCLPFLEGLPELAPWRRQFRQRRPVTHCPAGACTIGGRRAARSARRSRQGA